VHGKLVIFSVPGELGSDLSRCPGPSSSGARLEMPELGADWGVDLRESWQGGAEIISNAFVESLLDSGEGGGGDMLLLRRLVGAGSLELSFPSPEGTPGVSLGI